MRQTIVPGVWSWSAWQPDRNLDFNGFFVEVDGGAMVVDPIAPDDALLDELRARGVATVVVTNRDHERASAAVAQATGARVVASALDAPQLAGRVDATVQPGDVLHGWEVLGFEGLKTVGEIALYHRGLRAAIVGDAIWGTPAGALTMMPDAKLADPAKAALSLRSLRNRRLDHLLVGDGACAFGNARELLDTMFAARSGVAVERVNLDELEFSKRGAGDHPHPFTAQFAEVGRLLGAQKVGYSVGLLRRGDHYCPYHWHTAEEELFVVFAGTPTLRTPHGTFTLRRGDMVAFPTGESAAHRLWNDAEEDALVLMIGNNDPHDVCFYPDSDKFVVEATDTLVRATPQLDYFEGEVP